MNTVRHALSSEQARAVKPACGIASAANYDRNRDAKLQL